jgi:hypothetical protein
MIAKKTILWYGKTKKYLLLFLVETAAAAFPPAFGGYSCKILSVRWVDYYVGFVRNYKLLLVLRVDE